MKASESKIEILPVWPNAFQRDNAEPIEPDLIGAVILASGMPRHAGERIEGGGLAIQYKPANTSKAKCIMLAFNDCGMWVSRDS